MGTKSVLYQCRQGHMVTPEALTVMRNHKIPCIMCKYGEGFAKEFEPVPVDELPTTSDEYGEKVVTADEVMLYGVENPYTDEDGVL